jgi:thioesterase domain-containing protein/acyl carrier protein
MWECVLGVSSVGGDDSFFDLGGDSLQAVALICKIEKAFGRRVALGDLWLAPTPEKMAARLRLVAGANPDPVVLLKPGPERPLFCLPGSGGQLVHLHQLAQHFARERAFYALSYESLIERYPPGPAIEETAAHFVRAIQTVQATGPYAIAGYSFGGTVAFEMAHQLQAQGASVELLALLDTWGPNSPTVAPVARRLGVHSKILSRLPLKAKLRYVADRVGDRARRCLPQTHTMSPDDSLANIIQRLERGNHRAARRYQPKPYRGRVALFRASEQPRAIGTDASDPYMGWGPLAKGPLDCYEIPGAHDSMMRDANVQVLANLLSAALEAPATS